MSALIDDFLKDIEQKSAEPTMPETTQHSMFSHSAEFEKYAKDNNIIVDDDKGK